MSPKTPQIPPQAPRQVEKASLRIEVLAFPDVQMLDVAGPIQVFTAANERATSPHARLPYETRVIAPEGAEIRATSGLAFATEPLPDPTDPVDTLIVAGGQGVMRGRGGCEPDRMAQGPRRSGTADGLGLHRRLPARRGGSARPSPRRHALGILR